MKNRKLKLQQKIIFFIMLGMFVGFSGFIYVNYLLMRQTTTIEIHDKLRVKSQNLTKSIQKWLEDKQNMAIALAKQATKLKDKTPDEIRTYLNLINNSANIDASMIYYKGKNLIHTQLDWKQTPKQEEANMPYQTMLKNGFKPTISKVFKSPINKKDNMVAAIAPFEKNSIVNLVVEIKDVENEVSQTKFKGGFAVLFDTDKNILVHTNKNLTTKKIKTSLSKNLKQNIFMDKFGLKEYVIGSKNYIIVFDTIEITQWKMVLFLEKQVAFSKLNAQTKKILLISLGFYLLGTIFLIILNILHEYLRKKIEQKNDEYQKMLIERSRMSQMGELVSGINHQLHQPLNSLNLLSTSMLSRINNDTLNFEILKENLNTFIQVIQIMANTINTFKNFYKTNENITTFNLIESCQNILQILYVDFSKKSIHIEIINMCEKNLNITSIENFIQQILLVLLQNSKEALQVNNAVDKNIQIAISQKEDFIYIDVKDWGCGISEHLKLFDSIKNSKKPLGTGLGLYFARKIAKEKLQGELILLQSKMPTIFQFSFSKNLHKE